MRKVLTSRLNESGKEIRIGAISSKSYVHRILIGAALSGEEFNIKVNLISQDMLATMQVLKGLGFHTEVNNNIIYVNHKKALQNPTKGSQISMEQELEQDREKETEFCLDCMESGSTARFLLPVASALGKDFEMVGSGKLPERPFEVICKAMEENGVAFPKGYHLPMEVKGVLKPGRFSLPGNVSSQYISGLLFALPLLDGDSEIMLTTELESRPYVEITLSVLKQFGITVFDTENGYRIPGNQRYHASKEIVAEGDWSNAAFPLAMGAITDGVTMTGLNPDSLQGDKKILDLLKDFGCTLNVREEEISLKPGTLKGIKADVSQIPDLVPVLCVVASFAEGDSYFYQAQRLRIKESDRIETTKSCLSSLGGSLTAIEEADGSTTLRIKGAGRLSGGMVNGSNDHRIVMAAATAATGIRGRVVIEGTEAVNKSYPGFFEDMEAFIKECEE